MKEVVFNHLLLEQIFRHINTISDLKKISVVCKLWKSCSDREIRRRINRIDHLFFAFPVESSVSSDSLVQTTDSDKPFVLTDRSSVVQRLSDYYKNDIQMIPNIMVMFNGKLSRDEGWYSALNLKSYRKYLPKDCQFIHLENQTVIGTSDHNCCPYPAACGLAGISHLLLSKMTGVSIDVYSDQQICTSLKADPNIKCILFFESSEEYDRKSSSGDYLWHKCGDHMWDVMKQLNYKLAFGGTRSSAVDVTSGLGSGQPNKPFVCIVLSGPKVSACSLEMKTGTPESTEKLLIDFKSKLGFNADDTRHSTTFAFAFCRVIPYRFNRYCHFKEGQPSQLIHRIFPNVKFIGAISVSNFGNNQWPGLPLKSDEEGNYRSTLFDSTIIVLINIRKQNNHLI